MTCDRFIYFRSRVPTSDEIRRIIENYLGGCGTVTADGKDRWVIDLPGTPTSTFKGIEGAHQLMQAHEERWIEVVLLPSDRVPTLNILTRNQDEFVGAVADQLGRAFARFYRGKYESG